MTSSFISNWRKEDALKSSWILKDSTDLPTRWACSKPAPTQHFENRTRPMAASIKHTLSCQHVNQFVIQLSVVKNAFVQNHPEISRSGLSVQ